MHARVFIITTFYPEFLDELYTSSPGLGDEPFARQRERVFGSAFGLGDAYSHNLRMLGWEAEEVVCNADVMQDRWARDYSVDPTGNVHDRRRQIVAAQVERFRPDVVLVFEWCPLGDAFLAGLRDRVRLLVGQIGSAPSADRTFAAYDLVLSCWPPIVHYFREQGKAAIHFRLGFDDRMAAASPTESFGYDVSFVGGFADCHADRIPWLEHLLGHFDIAIFGYGLERVPNESAIHRHHRGTAWGRQMYEILHRSRITLHRQASIRVNGTASSGYAAAMRFFEATGAGTCLVTDAKEDLSAIFDPDREVVACPNEEAQIERIHRLLEDEDQRREIAWAGRRRTLQDHTIAVRMRELQPILEEYLSAAPCGRTGGRSSAVC